MTNAFIQIKLSLHLWTSRSMYDMTVAQYNLTYPFVPSGFQQVFIVKPVDFSDILGSMLEISFFCGLLALK